MGTILPVAAFLLLACAMLFPMFDVVDREIRVLVWKACTIVGLLSWLMFDVIFVPYSGALGLPVMVGMLVLPGFGLLALYQGSER